MSATQAREPPDWAAWQAENTAREASNLIRPEDADVVAGFVDLAVRTMDWLPPVTVAAFCFRMDASSMMCGSNQLSMWKDVPDDVARDWTDWREAYAALQARNPRLELADEIGWVGEVIDASSWPYEQEDVLKAWVDRGERLPLPRPPLGPWGEKHLDDAFYARLRELRERTGGWVYYDDVTNRRVFVSEA